jgi:pimeloyl-ACP methyl ester carboxylesterase
LRVSVDALDVHVLVDNITDSLSTVPQGVIHEWGHLRENGDLVLSGEALCCARRPEMVQPLALLEPAMPVPPAKGQPPAVRSGVAIAAELYRAGDKTSAVDSFMRAVAGPDYRAVVDRVLPQAFEQGVADADMFFGQELPAVQQWSFVEADAARIVQPALIVIGAKSREASPIWQRREDFHGLVVTYRHRTSPQVRHSATIRIMLV